MGPHVQEQIHGLINITGESKDTIAIRLAEIEILFLDTIDILGRLDGNVRPGNQAGHEHFGFRDGISQPPVAGFRDPNQGEVSTDPGIILLDEDGDSRIGNRPLWAKDSSFLAFRKLQQLVPEFNTFLENNPIIDTSLTQAQGSELRGLFPLSILTLYTSSLIFKCNVYP